MLEMMTDSRADLPDRLADDVDAAFPELVRTFQDGLYSGVLRLVWSHPDAEDLAQETLLRAYRALQGYPPQRIRDLRLAGWLWTIALNLCRNRARSRSRKPPSVPLTTEDQPPAPGNGPEETALAEAASQAWRARLAALPTPQRVAVVLRHVAGLSYDELADATGRPTGTVKADVHRGIARLRAMMEQEKETS